MENTVFDNLEIEERLENTVIDNLEIEERLKNINAPNRPLNKLLCTKKVVDVSKAVLCYLAAILSNLGFVLLIINEFSFAGCDGRYDLISNYSCIWGLINTLFSYCTLLFLGLLYWYKDYKRGNNYYLAGFSCFGILFTLFTLLYTRVVMKYFSVSIEQSN